MIEGPVGSDIEARLVPLGFHRGMIFNLRCAERIVYRQGSARVHMTGGRALAVGNTNLARLHGHCRNQVRSSGSDKGPVAIADCNI